MSQVICQFRGEAGENVEIVGGWDGPVSRFFLQIWADDRALYNSTYDGNLGRSPSLLQLKGAAADHAVVLGGEFWEIVQWSVMWGDQNRQKRVKCSGARYYGGPMGDPGTGNGVVRQVLDVRDRTSFRSKYKGRALGHYNDGRAIGLGVGKQWTRRGLPEPHKSIKGNAIDWINSQIAYGWGELGELTERQQNAVEDGAFDGILEGYEKRRTTGRKRRTGRKL
jgi:hypothetical protein